MRAAEILLRRVWPERKGRPLRFAMPPITGSSDLPAALGAVVMAIGNGELTPDEAQAVCAVLEAQRKAIETHDHVWCPSRGAGGRCKPQGEVLRHAHLHEEAPGRP
jgi:hypothetical protein